MGWKISKQFNFAYGHRVHTQKLDKEYALDRKCVCRHLHGHEAEVHVHLVGDELDKQGMVTDFLHLGWLKKFFDDTVDHKFIIDAHDPMFDRMIGNDNRHLLEEVYVPNTGHVAGWALDVARIPMVDLQTDGEYYESFFIVNFIPTSENLSKWVFDLADAKMSNMGVEVGEVEWWETPKSCSRYSPN